MSCAGASDLCSPHPASVSPPAAFAARCGAAGNAVSPDRDQPKRIASCSSGCSGFLPCALPGILRQELLKNKAPSINHAFTMGPGCKKLIKINK